jgi:hypothetical protein
MAVDGKVCSLNDFLHGEVDSSTFRHADHVRLAFEIMRRHNFPDAAQAYCASLKTIASRAGNSAAYHETITLAFLSLVSERMNGKRYADFAAFSNDNPDLMDKSVLNRWYDPKRLMSPLARATFVLPDARGVRP